MHDGLSRARELHGERMSKPDRRPAWFVTVLALAPTPLLLFVSPAIRLYLRNQEELHYQTAVLMPFIMAGLVMAALGAGLWSLSARPLFRYLTWSYVLLGPFWLAFRFLSGLAPEVPSLFGLAVAWSVETIPGIVLWATTWLVMSVVLTRRARLSSLAKPMAAFGLILLLGDVLTFLREASPSPDARKTGLQAPSSWDPPIAIAPNIYHIVLDELQTDVVEYVRTPDIDDGLSGFVYFPHNRAIYHSTVMSLSSTFTSSRYDYDRPRGDYIRNGFQNSSLIRTLVTSGYQTVALVPESDPIFTDENAFQHVVHHIDNFERNASLNATAFRNLWLVANIPPVLLDWAGGRGWLSERTEAEIRRTRAGRALTDSSPVASAMSFETLIENERALPDSGRYTFVHLLLPHSPYVLDEDCAYEWTRSEAPFAQTVCTLGLLTDYLDELASLGRLERSLIVIHGDHGAPYRVRKGELRRSRARTLATPLFVKPPGRARGQLERCEVDTSLLDVAPTILDATESAAEMDFEGSSVMRHVESCTGG